MANRRRAALERLDSLLRERYAAAGGVDGARDGTVSASFAAEAEVTRELLDPRVHESTTAWNDISRVLKNDSGENRLEVGLPTDRLVDAIWGPDRCALNVDWPIPSDIADPPCDFRWRWMIYDRAQHVMTGSVAEPVRLPPRDNVVGRGDWLDFSYALAKMLRHTGG
eukprot:7299056-Heterocapsa_arctica.AAC.1